MSSTQLCYHTPWGYWHITMTDSHITQLCFAKSCGCDMAQASNLTSECKAQLDAYCQGTLSHFTLPLLYRGTDFQNKVWETLRTIPLGATRSYKSIADALEKPGASRAVGNACNKNPLPIFIPCHRVMQKNGQLGGFAGGVEVKEALLRHEVRCKLEYLA